MRITYQRSITCLTLVVVVLSLLAAGWGIFSGGGERQPSQLSVYGETVTLYGHGVYRHESVSMAHQAKAQDGVTLLIGIPLLLVSLAFTRRGYLRGRLLLTGTMGYFLYTYASYCFVSMYNPLFLLYCALLSASFYAFVLLFKSIDPAELAPTLRGHLPLRSMAAFLFGLGGAVGMLWLGRLAPSLTEGTPPVGLDHYTTMVIQAFDIAFIIPAAVFSGIMLLRKQSIGLLLATVIIMKGATLALSINAMLLYMLYIGDSVAPAEQIIFPLIAGGILVFLTVLLKQVVEPGGRKPIDPEGTRILSEP